MNSIRPPKLALWILKSFGCSPNNEAVIGDLVEQYHQRQSPTWFWKQSLIAVASGFYEEAFANKLLMLGAILVGFGVNVASEWLVFHFALGFLPLSGSLHWSFIYRPALTAAVNGAVSGCIVAAVSRQHYRATVLGYALTVMVIAVVQFTAFSVYVRPYLSEQERALSMVPLVLGILYIPAILVGGFGSRARQRSDLKEQV